MNFIKKILSGDLIKNVDRLVDNLTTTKEEKLELSLSLKKAIMDAEAKASWVATSKHSSTDTCFFNYINSLVDFYR